jgi:hypothetical protein
VFVLLQNREVGPTIYALHDHVHFLHYRHWENLDSLRSALWVESAAVAAACGVEFVVYPGCEILDQLARDHRVEHPWNFTPIH